MRKQKNAEKTQKNANWVGQDDFYDENQDETEEFERFEEIQNAEEFFSCNLNE